MLKCECMWPAKWLAKINPHCEEVHVAPQIQHLYMSVQMQVVHKWRWQN